ncbi:MAG: thiolase domain-containing protein [Actinomycetota bacterium]|nr:thiolase domain-containing protein [Actinomycetota bacterium]
MNPVAIAGVGQTKHSSARKDVSLAGLIREATARALADAAVDPHDIDAVVLGTAPDFFEGVMMPDWSLAGALGAMGKPLLRVHTMGSVGGATAVTAALHVASGMYRRVLAVGFEKHSESQAMWGLSPTNPWGRTFGAGAGAAFAPICRAYIERTGAPAEIGPRVAVKARENARRNPFAHLQLQLTLDDVLGSPMLWDPIRRLESCPQSDGACAMVFVDAASAPRGSAWVRGVSTKAEALAYPGRDVLHPASGTTCAARAYAQAGIDEPARAIDVAEIYEPFSWIEVLLYEALGLCGSEQGWRMFDRGESSMGGRVPVNPSGGVLSTNPIGASGMLRMAEAALQVMGRAGERQVEGARTALGHAYGGTLSYHACMVLSSEAP